MSSVDDRAASRRPHDAQASRQALLDAARSTFEELGYDRATTREIGDRAGVDPALISRYFDSKEGLFMAAIVAGAGEDDGIDFEPRALISFLLERWDERGHSPLSRALATPTLTDDMRGQVSEAVGERLLRGLVGRLRERDVADPQLRAELLIALAVGVSMTRANGTLEELAGASRERVLAALDPIVYALGLD